MFQTMINDVDRVNEKLERSKSDIETIQQQLKSSSYVLDDLEQNENTADEFDVVIQNAKSELNSIMDEKSRTDQNTEEIIEQQKIGITTWITMLDDNIRLHKRHQNLSLVQFLVLLRNGTQDYIKHEARDDILRVIQVTIQVR